MLSDFSFTTWTRVRIIQEKGSSGKLRIPSLVYHPSPLKTHVYTMILPFPPVSGNQPSSNQLGDHTSTLGQLAVWFPETVNVEPLRATTAVPLFVQDRAVNLFTKAVMIYTL